MKYDAYTISPRLYTDLDIAAQTDIPLDSAQSHYLKSVLRKNIGDTVRLFNGRDGEWRTEIKELEKKSGLLATQEQLREQTNTQNPVHLLFAPIKKNRLDFLIEKSVELGVNHLHPVITARTENRKLNEPRINAQIIEAAKQCERLDIPTLHSAVPLKQVIQNWPTQTEILWAAERLENLQTIDKFETPQAFLIGPEGGFDDEETTMLQTQDFIQPVSLGERILRAETAALLCLSQIKLST